MAVNVSLEPSITSLASVVPFLVQHATPVPLTFKEIDLSPASNPASGSLKDWSQSHSQLIPGSAARIVDLNPTSTGIDPQDSQGKQKKRAYYDQLLIMHVPSSGIFYRCRLSKPWGYG